MLHESCISICRKLILGMSLSAQWRESLVDGKLTGVEANIVCLNFPSPNCFARVAFVDEYSIFDRT